jgi:hypothetical protein
MPPPVAGLSPTPADLGQTVDAEPSAATPGIDVTADAAPGSPVAEGRTGTYLPGAAAAPQAAEPEGAAGTLSLPEGGRPPVAGLAPVATGLRRGPVAQTGADPAATTADERGPID